MSKFNFKAKKRALVGARQRALDAMANNAVNYFKVDVFEKEAFDGKSWKPRKDRDQSRKLMVKSGRLRQSITVTRRSINGRRVGTYVPYAGYHNYGTSRLPQRKMIGNSRWLNKINMVELLRAFKRVL